MTKHELEAFGSDLLEDGVFALCSCGWKSWNADDEYRALRLYRAHKEEAEDSEQEREQ
jgi:hypothetical protein